MKRCAKFNRAKLLSMVAAIALAAFSSGCSGDFLAGADERLDYTFPTFDKTAAAVASASDKPGAAQAPQATPDSNSSDQAITLVPQTGDTRESNEYAVIDYSNITSGYFAVKNLISDKKVKMQVTQPDSTIYTYTLSPQSKFEYFPLTHGSGEYTASVYKNLEGDQYAFVVGVSFRADIDDEFSPFLYPNQYVWFEPGDDVEHVSQQVCRGAQSELDRVELIYDYVINNISYDDEKYDKLAASYLPDCDKILAQKSGICFDYAALMCAMLRLEGIPTKLIIGYAGELKHAWISVYIKEIGWVDEIIRFDGKNWVRMDPTFAANSSDGDPGSLAAYIGDGKNYNDMYFY